MPGNEVQSGSSLEKTADYETVYDISIIIKTLFTYTAFVFSWLKAYGVVLPSEQRQRKLSHELIGDHLESEAAPFSFPLKHGGEDLHPAPLVFVSDLTAFIFQHLEQNERYIFKYMYNNNTRFVQNIKNISTLAIFFDIHVHGG